jgi:predicted dehydrogenase
MTRVSRSLQFKLQTSHSQKPHTEIRWGIVGTGIIANHFASDLALVKNARLEAVVSRSLATASNFTNAHGGHPHDSLDGILSNDAIDAIYIASPNDTHFSTAEAAIAAGKAVLVEKPLVVSSAEAVRLKSLAQAKGVFVMEAMWTRFLPAMTYVRDVIRSGDMGEILAVNGELAFHQPYSSQSRFFDRARGGGSLLDLGVYGLSLCLDLFGKPDAVDGEWCCAPTGVDLSAQVNLRFGGFTARVKCGLDQTGANLFIIQGSKATLVVQPPFNAACMIVQGTGAFMPMVTKPGVSSFARISRKLARTIPLPGVSRLSFPFEGHGLQFEIEAVGQALVDGLTEHPLAPLDDSIETLRIIEAVVSMPSISKN